MKTKSVGTKGEEDVLPPRAALAPLLPKLELILLILGSDLGCTLAVVEKPHGQLLHISLAARGDVEQGGRWFRISTLGILRHGER